MKARIEEAQQFVPLENLSISPQCGFASTEEGNRLDRKSTRLNSSHSDSSRMPSSA